MTKKLPWEPADYDIQIVAAVKAVAGGTGTEHQQTLVMRYIIDVLGAYHELSFRPKNLGGDRGTAFMEGRRYVGQQLTKLINLSMSVVRKDNDRREHG